MEPGERADGPGRARWRALISTAPARYALAALATGLACWLRLDLADYLGPTYILFYPTVLLTALMGGLGPGLLATALSALLAAAWILPAERTLPSMGTREAVSLAVFVFNGALVSVVARLYRRARRRIALRDAEERSRRREEATLHRYELLAANSRDIFLFIRREDGRILEANAAARQAYGYTEEELRALSIRELRAPEAQESAARQLEEADRQGLRFETVHRRKDGTTLQVEVSSQGATIGGARVLLSVIRDVSERKEAEERLREADRRKTDFLAVLSHELRNPLAPIRNSLHLLDRTAPGSEAARRAREVLHRQTEHLGRLVDDLLDVSRIAHGKMELQRARLDTREVVRRACDDVAAEFEQRGDRLRITLPVEPLWIDADADRLTQMVGNLLSNALKFTPAGGQVHVTAGRREGSCQVTVRDDGAGIEAADLDRIFDPFVQVARGHGGPQGGMGVGLALVRELATLHGGSVRAASAGPGQGAVFVLELPLVPAPVGAASPARARPPVSGLTILIVEDNEDAGATLAEVLTLGGHRVSMVATGRGGVEAVGTSPPDVLICDVGLPDLSGHGVIRAIRAAGVAPGLFAIALTGFGLPEDRRVALEAGFDAHLAKPMKLEVLNGLLAEATRRRASLATPASPG